MLKFPRKEERKEEIAVAGKGNKRKELKEGKERGGGEKEKRVEWGCMKGKKKKCARRNKGAWLAIRKENIFLALNTGLVNMVLLPETPCFGKFVALSLAQGFLS